MSKQTLYPVRLSDWDVRKLKRIQKEPDIQPTAKVRCQILLDLDENHGAQYSRAACAERNGTSVQRVLSVVKRYQKDGAEEAVRYHRNQDSDIRKHRLLPEQEEQLVRMVRDAAPDVKRQLTTRKLAAKAEDLFGVEVSKDTISRILRRAQSTESAK